MQNFGNKQFEKSTNSLTLLTNKRSKKIHRPVVSILLICGKYYIALEQAPDTLFQPTLFVVSLSIQYEDALNVSLTELKCVLLNNERPKSITQDYHSNYSSS